MRLSSLVEVVDKLKTQTIGMHMVKMQSTSQAALQMPQLYIHCIIGKKKYMKSMWPQTIS
jgi:hypothetical protein